MQPPSVMSRPRRNLYRKTEYSDSENAGLLTIFQQDRY